LNLFDQVVDLELFAHRSIDRPNGEWDLSAIESREKF
jgi:hypothetical protein